MCGNTRGKDPGVSFHHFPSERKNPERREVWLCEFGIQEETVNPDSRVCSTHFPGRNVELSPITTLGKRFASPIKKGVRAERAEQREEQKCLRELSRTSTPSSSRSVTPMPSSAPSTQHQVHTASVGEQYESDF